MKRFVLYLIFLMIAYTGAFPDSIKFITPKVLDFGRVIQGEEIEGAFKMLITGNKIVEIESIRPGCGCTVVKDLPMTYNPGDTLTIPFTLNTHGFQGSVVKPITVSFKNTDIQSEKLNIRATIYQDLCLSKRYLLFRNIPIDPNIVVSDSLFLVNASEDTVHLTEVIFASDLITLDYENKPIAPNDSLVIKVRLHPMMAANVPVYIHFKTDREKKQLPILDLRVYIDIREQ